MPTEQFRENLSEALNNIHNAQGSVVGEVLVQGAGLLKKTFPKFEKEVNSFFPVGTQIAAKSLARNPEHLVQGIGVSDELKSTKTKFEEIDDQYGLPDVNLINGMIKFGKSVFEAPKRAQEIGTAAGEEFKQAKTKKEKAFAITLGGVNAIFNAVGTGTLAVPAFEAIEETVPKLKEINAFGWEGLSKMSLGAADIAITAANNAHSQAGIEPVSEETEQFVKRFAETVGPVMLLAGLTHGALKIPETRFTDIKTGLKRNFNTFLEQKIPETPAEIRRNIVESYIEDFVSKAGQTEIRIRQSRQRIQHVTEVLTEAIKDPQGVIPDIVLKPSKRPDSPFNTAWEKVKFEIDSNLSPIKTLDRLALAEGYKSDLYDSARVAQSSGGGMTLNAIKRKNIAMKTAAAEGYDLIDLAELWVLKRQPDLAAKGIKVGVNLEDAKNRINALKEKYGEADFMIMEGYVKYFQNEFTRAKDRLLETGRISQELYNTLEITDPNYAPYFRDVMQLEGEPLVEVGEPIKRLSKTGSELNIINPLVSFDDAIYQIFKAAEKNVKLEQLPQVAEVLPDFIKKVSKSNENTVTYYDKGKAQYFEVDPYLAKAFNGKRFVAESGILHWAAKTANDTLRAGATGLNPIFQFFTNPAKDFISNKIITAKTTGGVSIKEIWTARKGIRDWQKGIDSPLVREYQQALNEGALITPRGSEFTINIGENIKQLQLSGEGGFKAYAINPLTAGKEFLRILEEAGSRAENGTRFANWLKAKEQGYTAKERALISRDSTVDFMTKGNTMASLNEVYAFLNASYQGSKNILANAAKSPKETTAALTQVVVAPSIAVTLWNLTYAEDEYRRFIAERPGVNKTSWIIAIPDSDIVLVYPKPWVYNAPGLLAEEMVDYAMTGNEVDLKAVGETFIDGLNPVGNSIFPTILRPYQAVISNKTWYGGQIRPETIGSSSPDPMLNYFLERPPKDVYLGFAKFLDDAANYTGQNWLKQSPADIEYTIESYTAAVGKIAGQSIDSINSLFDGEFDFTKLPLSSTFIKRRTDAFPPVTDEFQRMKLKVFDRYLSVLNLGAERAPKSEAVKFIEDLNDEEKQLFIDIRQGRIHLSKEEWDMLNATRQDVYNVKVEIRRDTLDISNEIIAALKADNVTKAKELLKTLSADEVQYGWLYWRDRLTKYKF